MMNTTDKQQAHDELVHHYQNGEPKALKKLIRSFHPLMKKTIYYQVQEQKPVEDIAQDCWYIIINKLPNLELEVGFNAWALSIARRKAIDWIRKQQRSTKHFRSIKNDVKSKTEQTSTDSNDKLQKIQGAIQHLPTTQQIVLELFYMDNLSLQEISNVLEVSKGTVKSRLFYAREKLKQVVSSNEKEN